MARIDHYEFGRIMIDGRQETKDLIILPGRVVRNWWRHDGHALVLDDLNDGSASWSMTFRCSSFGSITSRGLQPEASWNDPSLSPTASTPSCGA
jgi:hypothetical protein